MNLKNADKICVAGWGKTGAALVKLLLSLGKKPKVTEIKSRAYFSSSLIEAFEKKGVEFEFGGHSEGFVSASNLILLSPGINLLNSSLGKIAYASGIPCVGEIEFAWYFCQAKIIAITGTNGKTTVAHLTYLLLKKARKKVFLAGNIGRPFSDIVLDAKAGDFIVLEVSSFQLESILKFRPHIAVLLNIYPDHLNRHKDFEGYVKAKMKIFQNQKENDWALVGKNNELFRGISSKIRSQIIYFGSEFPDDNLSCVYRIGRLFNISKTDSFLLFSQYKNLPHRRQQIKTINKVKFINDSKATNPSSTFFALDSIKGSVTLIAGGRDKGVSYSGLRRYCRKIKKINLIGEAADKIRKDLEGKIKCQDFSSLREAVISSYQEAAAGETVLFSPMCSSFDMFSDYRQRGREFIEIVKTIS